MTAGRPSLTRFIPAALGLICAALLTVTLVTCSGAADHAISNWLPSDDYGEKAFEHYALVTEDSQVAPELIVTPPSWVIGVATDSATEDDPSRSYTHLTYTFDTGNVVMTYASDKIDDFLAWQLNEDTIITSHLFGGRYTDIVVGTPTHATFGEHDVTWGMYSYLNEYERQCISYVSAAAFSDGQVLTVVTSEELRDGTTEAHMNESRLAELWEGVTCK